jgi:polyhydroxyalkanoate synthesis regulator protein
MSAITVVVYDNIAEMIEEGDHFKVLAKQKTPSKRNITQIILEKVNTGGRPRDTK